MKFKFGLRKNIIVIKFRQLLTKVFLKLIPNGENCSARKIAF